MGEARWGWPSRPALSRRRVHPHPPLPSRGGNSDRPNRRQGVARAAAGAGAGAAAAGAGGGRRDGGKALDEEWPVWAHKGQLPPDGDWRIWLTHGGRGFGKTRAGRGMGERAGARRRRTRAIALVAATLEEARRVMVEGPSGLLAVARDGEERRRCSGSRALGRLTLRERRRGVRLFGRQRREPARARASFRLVRRARQMEQARGDLGQSDARPAARATAAGAGDDDAAGRCRCCGGCSAMPETVRDRRARRADNPHVVRRLHRGDGAQAYGGTRLGRQELDGELIEDLEGALWPRGADRERARTNAGLSPRDCPPAGRGRGRSAGLGRGRRCGIVVCGLGEDGIGYVLADHSAPGSRPRAGRAKVAGGGRGWGADRVVAEAQQGGEMVESVLRGGGPRCRSGWSTPRAARSARAEPVAALFESGEAKFAGRFPALEDELAGLTSAAAMRGRGASPTAPTRWSGR